MALLMGEPPSHSEMLEVSNSCNVSLEELAYGDQLEGVNVLAENIRFLIDSLPHGGQRELANTIETDETTVSRWKSGSVRPGTSRQDRLLEYFQLPRGTDLAREPLFLALDPIGGFAKRAWVLKRVGEIEVRELEGLFPALRKMLT